MNTSARKNFCRVLLLLMLLPGIAGARIRWFNHPESRRIECFASGGNYILAAGFGIYKSSDGGESWTSITGSLKGNTIGSIAVYKGTIYASAEFHRGVFKSTDEGKTWTPCDSSIMDHSVHAFKVAGDKLYAGITGGLYVLSEDGIHWNELTKDLDHPWVFSFAVKGNTILLGTQYGVQISEDAGKSWKEMNTGLPDTRIECIEMVGSHIIAGTSFDGVFWTTETTREWVGVNRGLENTYVRSMLADKNGFFTGTNYGIFFSADPGTSWQKVHPIPDPNEQGDRKNRVHVSTRTNALFRSGSYIFAGINDEGVFRSSDNGKTWEAVNEGMIAPQEFRWSMLYRLLTTIAICLFWILLWGYPFFLLRKLERGKGIYFIHLFLGLAFVGAGLLLFANRPTRGFDFSNVVNGLIIVSIWTLWGLLFFFYSFFKKRKAVQKIK